MSLIYLVALIAIIKKNQNKKKQDLFSEFNFDSLKYMKLSTSKNGVKNP